MTMRSRNPMVGPPIGYLFPSTCLGLPTIFGSLQKPGIVKMSDRQWEEETDRLADDVRKNWSVPAKHRYTFTALHDPTAAMAPGEKAKVELSSLNEVGVSI